MAIMADYINAVRIDHLAINVTDLATSAAWYKKLLGLEVFHKWDNAWLLARGPIHLGLYSAAGAAAVVDLDHTLAMKHFAFLVSADDFVAAEVFLHENQIAFDGPRDTGVAFSIFVRDPDGYQVELTRYHKPEAG
jgi:catechol 2,3-dioxygenase-like lactoylglutathione lyase family enzyme